jgi:hypothetical protein
VLNPPKHQTKSNEPKRKGRSITTKLDAQEKKKKKNLFVTEEPVEVIFYFFL